MTRSLNLTVLLTTLLLLVAPARAEKTEQALPPQAVGDNTMVAVYVDVTQMDPRVLAGLGQMLKDLTGNETLRGQGLALPVGDPDQVVDGLALLRDSFLQAGGEGIAMTIEMPSEESWSPPMSLLMKTGDTFDVNAMDGMVRSMSEGQGDTTIDALGNGWQNIVIKAKDGQAVTLPLPNKPSDAAFTALNKQLTQRKKPMFAVAFRMQDEIREMMAQAEEAAQNVQPGQGEDPQAQMMMGMLVGMFKPVHSLDTIGLAISRTDAGEMLVDAQMTFENAQSAQQFATTYNTILTFAPVILAQAGQGGEIENMPDPATINRFFMKMRMQTVGESLKLRLDQEFLDLAQKLAPFFEGMQGQLVPGAEL